MLIKLLHQAYYFLRSQQVLSQLPALCEARTFITAFTNSPPPLAHLCISWAKLIQSMLPHTTSRKSILILYFHLRLCLPSSSSPPKPCVHHSPYPIRATCSAYVILFYLVTRIIFGYLVRSKQHKPPSCIVFFHHLFTSSLLGLNILLSTLFSDNLSLRRSFNVSDQVSHPYKTTGNCSSVCLNICVFG